MVKAKHVLYKLVSTYPVTSDDSQTHHGGYLEAITPIIAVSYPLKKVPFPFCIPTYFQKGFWSGIDMDGHLVIGRG